MQDKCNKCICQVITTMQQSNERHMSYMTIKCSPQMSRLVEHLSCPTRGSHGEQALTTMGAEFVDSLSLSSEGEGEVIFGN